MMRIGIVGLPNVGKSTLFNALTGAGALVANYPFATIKPNVGVVPIPDDRLTRLARIYRTDTIIPAVVEFVDIAGLVKGASHGEGLGNQFLSHIREVDAILHVVRCFEDQEVAHVGPVIDPVDDFRTVELELILADLAHLERHRVKLAKSAKSQDREALAELALTDRLLAHLNQQIPARLYQVDQEETLFMSHFSLLTRKPLMVVANVRDQSEDNPLLQRLRDDLREESLAVLPVIANLEAEISELASEEQAEFRLEWGVSESSLTRILRQAYRTLGLISFFTGNEKEVHAWTVKEGSTALTAAGKIHTDFVRGFIRAEVVHYQDLEKAGTFAAARELGLVKSEGKTYQVRDGDYILFRFNV
jgi:GTP-binding protein YchF